MSANTFKFQLSDGSSVLVETADEVSGAPSESGVEAVPRFDRAAARLRPLAATLLEHVRGADPGKVTIGFSLKFDGNGEPIVAMGDADAVFRINLEWQRGGPPRPREDRPQGGHRRHHDDRRDRDRDDRRGDDYDRRGYDDRRGPPRRGPLPRGGPRRANYRKDWD